MGRQILRAPWHDYRSRCIYMVTMCKAAGVREFGMLAGDYRVPRGQFNSPFVSTTPVGMAIKGAIRNFYRVEPEARVLQYAIMPDHIHLIIFVETPTQATLGMIVARFKAEVNNLAGFAPVFEKGFNDQILDSRRDLNTLFEYVRDNPRRLAVRQALPQFFRRVDTLNVNGKAYQAYGNVQLMDNPFKEQVVVHRADTAEQRERHRQEWLYTACNGGVLVSPFISGAERAVRAEAEAMDARIILVTAEPFGERYKPAAHDFEQCEAGRLLIISAPVRERALSRSTCLAMNALAAAIAAQRR